MPNNYEKLTVKELREVAKNLNIPGRWDMTKAKLVEAITGAESEKANVGGITKVVDNDINEESATEEKVIDNQKAKVEEETEIEKKSCAAIDTDKRVEYVERVSAGTLIAFRLPSGKVISAKIKRKSTKRKLLQVETSYGAEHLVPFKDVLWVRTGKRWPRGVYNLLKGIDE